MKGSKQNSKTLDTNQTQTHILIVYLLHLLPISFVNIINFCSAQRNWWTLQNNSNQNVYFSEFNLKSTWNLFTFVSFRTFIKTKPKKECALKQRKNITIRLTLCLIEMHRWLLYRSRLEKPLFSWLYIYIHNAWVNIQCSSAAFFRNCLNL